VTPGNNLPKTFVIGVLPCELVNAFVAEFEADEKAAECAA
jgi:hypothetical protein